jgi:putative membrane protein
MSYEMLPLLNAWLNMTSAVLLGSGYLFIRLKHVGLHRLCMLGAFVASTLFLISYVTFHAHAGVVHFKGQGLIRTVYFSILISHTILAIVIVPLVLRTLYLALRSRFDTHRKWARWTLPLWFYVSMTGVVIYEMLY